MRSPQLTRTQLLLIIAGLIYVLSPVDFIPELILGPLGLADDASIMALILMTVTRSIQEPRVIKGRVD